MYLIKKWSIISMVVLPCLFVGSEHKIYIVRLVLFIVWKSRYILNFKIQLLYIPMYLPTSICRVPQTSSKRSVLIIY